MRLLSISIKNLGFSRDNLPRVKDGANIINLDDKQSKETHWVSLFIDGKAAVYFDIFATEYIPQDVLYQSLITDLEYNLIVLLCVDFIVLLS